jgi:hypothetical protein
MSEESPQRSRETIERELSAKAWQDDAFLEELRRNPKAVIAREYGVQVPDTLNLKVIEETPDTLYIRLSNNPANFELSDEQLEQVAGGEVLLIPGLFQPITTIPGPLTTIPNIGPRW